MPCYDLLEFRTKGLVMRTLADADSPERSTANGVPPGDICRDVEEACLGLKSRVE